MAVDVVSYRPRRKGDGDRAAKEKRQKIVLGVLGGVLLLILVIEGPKTLKKLHGSSPGPASSVAAPAAAPTSSGATGAAPQRHTGSLAAVRHFPAKDPFVAQLGASAGGAPAQELAQGPAVRASHFVAKDPFVQQLTLAAPAAPVTAGAPPASGASGAESAAGSGDYIVIVASVPVSDGHGVAVREAARARAGGVASVRIVNSSKYPTLRTGFYAVYSGPYPTLAALLPALEQVRGQGYPSAYTRRLAH